MLNLCTDPVWANADATRIEEVFVNLLNNAAKYTDEGGRIEVWCEHQRGDNYVRVRIRDNGVGIDKKLQPRIFDLFTQADRLPRGRRPGHRPELGTSNRGTARGGHRSPKPTGRIGYGQ